MYNYYREPWLVDRVRGHARRGLRPPPCVSTPRGHDPVGARRQHRAGARSTCPPGETFDRCRRRRRRRRPTTTRSRTSARRAFPASTSSPSPSSSGCRSSPSGSPADRCSSMVAVSRPVVHGSGVPAPGDEERRAVRPAVRHDVVRQRLRVRRRPAVGAVGGDGQQAGPDPADRGALRRAAGDDRRQLVGARCASCSTCRSPSAWWSPSSWRSPRSSSPTSCSPSAFGTRRRRPRRSAPTCSARCSAGSPSTWRSIVGYRHLLLVVAALYAAAFLLRPSRASDPLDPTGVLVRPERPARRAASSSPRGRLDGLEEQLGERCG